MSQVLRVFSIQYLTISIPKTMQVIMQVFFHTVTSSVTAIHTFSH